jgi:NTE family protein
MKRAVVAFFMAFAAALLATAEPSAEAGRADPPRPRVALVLSGGSALGIAHVGVIRELERAGIPIDMVLGTSMGALVGGLYAAGYSPDDMESFVVGVDWSRYFFERRSSAADRYLDEKHRRYPVGIGFDGKKLLLERGLIKGQSVLSLFSALTLHVMPTRDFDDLPVPYRAVAADIRTGEKYVFSSGSIAEAMRASMSIPGLFSPYELGGRSLVDGGIADNMPVDIAREMGADIVIAVECRRQLPDSATELGNGLDVTNQTVSLFIEENMIPSRENADLLIRPDLSAHGRLSFADAASLISEGEAGARAQGADISALAARIAASRPLVSPELEPNRRAMREPPALERLEVDAPSASDEAIARKAFAGLVSKKLERADVEEALDEVYASGGYSLVKLDLLPADSEDKAVGHLRIIASEPHRNELLFGGSYRGLVSDLGSNQASVMSGLYFGDITGRDSALFFELGLGSLTRAYAEYFKPIGPFFVMPYLRYQSQYDYYYLGRGLVLRADYQSAGGGLGLGCSLGRDAQLSVGWAFDSVLGLAEEAPSDTDAALPKADRDNAGFLFLLLGFDDRQATVFPERGLASDLRLRWAHPAFGGEDYFVAAELRWNAALALSRRLSLGFAGCAATDFSGVFPEGPYLPQTRLFDLSANGMFYGLDPRPDLRTGHHMLGVGLELRRKLGRISRTFGGDVFGLANLSVATAYQDEALADERFPLRWNPSLGLGLRISRTFGLLVAGGVVVDSGDFVALRPAFCLQLGSFDDFSEDRR